VSNTLYTGRICGLIALWFRLWPNQLALIEWMLFRMRASEAVGRTGCVLPLFRLDFFIKASHSASIIASKLGSYKC
jgi:hypothetical protein